MRLIIPVAEQLDRACRELADERPVSGRIALILVDNALELMCHGKAAYVLQRSRTELTIGQRADLEGQDFGSKIAALRLLGHLPERQAQGAAMFHRYRNQLYHVGLRNDPVVGDLARLYYELTLGLMPALLQADRYLRWEPVLLDDSARRLIPELATATRYRNKVSIQDLATRLQAALPPPRDIPAALQAHLLARIDQCEADFEIIARGRSGKDDPDETLVRIQREHDTLDAFRKTRRKENKELKRQGRPERLVNDVVLSMARGTRVLVDLGERLLPRWRPTYPKRPFDLWRREVGRVGKAKTGLEAAERFDRVLGKIEALDGVMAEPIEEMLGWHQHMEDVAMDSR